MEKEIDVERIVDQIVARDPRFHREAYFFIREALDYTQKMIARIRKARKTEPDKEAEKTSRSRRKSSPATAG
jgi:uncharacterized repeat protein (TIGR04138 family)